MDQLLCSLRALSLLPPSPSQLLQLLSSPSDHEAEEKEVRDLARVLSLGSYDPDSENEDEADEGGMAGFGVDRELVEDAVVEMIRSFRKDVAKMRSAYEDEEMQRQKPVTTMKATPLHFLKLRHEALIRQDQKMHALFRGYRPKIIFSGGPSYSSGKELAQLKAPSANATLRCCSRLDGQYIIARVASAVSIYVGATFLVTLPEPFGFSIPLSVSHFTTDPTLSWKNASKLLPEGTILAIKEPYFSLHHSLRASGTSGGVGIRVDTPTDLVVLASSGNETTLEDDWQRQYITDLKWPVESARANIKGAKRAKKGSNKVEGDDLQQTDQTATTPGVSEPATWLQEGALSHAILCQRSKAPPWVTIGATVETAKAFLDSGRPGAALREILAAQQYGIFGAERNAGTEVGVSLETLRGDALYRMQAWSEAAEAFKSALSLSSEAKADLTAKIDASRRRQFEAQNGPDNDADNVARVYFAHLDSANPRIEIADWMSSDLKVAQIPNAGRGLITTKPVKAGTPLLTAKSRGSSYPSDPALQDTPILRCNFQNGVLSTTTQVKATTNLIHIMIDRPEVTQEILGLTAGPGTPDSGWVKASHFEKARAKVAEENSWRDLTPSRIGPTGGINALYVDEVLRHNAFGPGVIKRNADDAADKAVTPLPNGSLATDHLPPALRLKLDRDPPSAFARSTQPHPLPAILNHSCLPNVSSVFLGDVVITRALRDLNEGEEIGHEYVRGGVDYAGRQSTLSKHGFVCACPLCELDRRDGPDALDKRRKILALKGPAILGRSDALLRHSGATTDVSEKDRENHREVRESLEELHSEIAETYNPSRGPCRPELRDIQGRIGRHAGAEGDLALAVWWHLESLRSVNAILEPAWDALTREPPTKDESLAEQLSNKLVLESKRLDELPSSASISLLQAPALHVDEAQATLWRLAQLFAATHSNLSLVWSQTAYWTHEILIAGGCNVFRDRWGPTNAHEDQTLEWKDAWNLWTAAQP